MNLFVCCVLLVITSPVVLAGSSSCSVCELVVDELDQFMLNNSTKQDVIEELDNMCYMLFDDPSEQKMCLVVVYASVCELYSFLQNSTSLQVCQKIDMCSSLKSPVNNFTNLVQR